MNRATRRRTFAIMAVLFFLVTLRGMGWSNTQEKREPTVIPAKPAIQPFSVGYDNDGYEGFHHSALKFALTFLEKQGNLIYANKELFEKYAQFGVLYADEPWSGVPGEPHKDVIGDKDLPWFSYKIEGQNYDFEKKYDFCLSLIQTHLNANLSHGIFSYTFDDKTNDGITNPETERKVNPYVGARWNIRIASHWRVPSHPSAGALINRNIGPIADENMHHFKNSHPIALIVEDEEKGCFIKTSDIKFAGTNITKTPIAEMTISAQEYGATLYQLARKFFPSTCDLGPLLHTLPYKKAPGNILWPIYKPISLPLFPIYFIEGINKIAMPSTYIGGQPYMCYRSTPPPSDTPFDTCRLPEGKPSWPLWMAAEAKDAASMERILKNPSPNRNIETALVYLGWAIHVMQDLSVPAHQGDVHGDEVHTQFEDGAAWTWKHILDKEQLSQELMNDPDIQKLLSVRPTSDGIPNRTICSELGWPMDQPVGNLGVKLAQSGFEKTASLNLPLKNGEEEYKKAIIRSIRDTIVMLACLTNKVVDVSTCEKETLHQYCVKHPKDQKCLAIFDPPSEKLKEKLKEEERLIQFCVDNPKLCGGGVDLPGPRPKIPDPDPTPTGLGKRPPKKIPPGPIPGSGSPGPSPLVSPR